MAPQQKKSISDYLGLVISIVGILFTLATVVYAAGFQGAEITHLKEENSYIKTYLDNVRKENKEDFEKLGNKIETSVDKLRQEIKSYHHGQP